MAKQRFSLRNIRLVYKQTPMTTKIVILCAIILSTAALLTLRWKMLDAQAQADALRQYAQELEQEKQLLQDKIDKLGTEDSVGDIAKDELDLVDKDTIMIKPEG